MGVSGLSCSDCVAWRFGPWPWLWRVLAGEMYVLSDVLIFFRKLGDTWFALGFVPGGEVVYARSPGARGASGRRGSPLARALPVLSYPTLLYSILSLLACPVQASRCAFSLFE